MLRKAVLGTTAGVGVGGAVYYINQRTDNKATQPVSAPKEAVKPLPRIDLPDKVQYLVVGGGATTFGACRAIRTFDPKAQVLVVGEENHLPYMKSALSKELWQGDKINEKLTFSQWNNRERSILFEHPEYYYSLDSLKQNEPGVAYVGGLKISKVDAVKKIVHFADGSKLEYGSCLIAPGSKLKKHSILSNNRAMEPFIVNFNGVEDFKKLQKAVLESKSVVVVGGGTIASELVVNISDFAKRANHDLKLVQVFPESGNMTNLLPEYMAKWLTRQISAQGVRVITGADILSAVVVCDRETKKQQVRLRLTSGEEITVDRIALATELEPNIDFAKDSGLEVDNQNGGILVNAEFQARKDLFVAGDASSFFDQQLGRRRIQGHDHGISSGRIAGKNMVGGQYSYSRQPIMWSDIGNLVSFEGVGILDPKLETYSVFFPENPEQKPDFNGKISKGVIFYKNDKDVVVGVLLCNVFSRLGDAEKIINEQKPLDLKDVAKIFYERPQLVDLPTESEPEAKKAEK